LCCIDCELTFVITKLATLDIDVSVHSKTKLTADRIVLRQFQYQLWCFTASAAAAAAATAAAATAAVAAAKWNPGCSYLLLLSLAVQLLSLPALR
jgi:hypothetical protein